MTGKQFIEYIKSGDISEKAAADIVEGMNIEADKMVVSLNQNAGLQSELNDGLSFALRALCLTRDYVGEKTLPAIEGWEWHDAGVAICKLIPDDPWAAQFQKRIKR